MKRHFLLPALFLLMLSSFSLAHAAAPDRIPNNAAPRAELRAVPAAVLMRVDEGVFELDIGKSIDLTERKVLLNISFRRKEECCDIRINGDSISGWRVGSRIDLKKERSTRDFFADREQCFLDIVDLLVPKGASAKATFRLHCI